MNVHNNSTLTVYKWIKLTVINPRRALPPEPGKSLTWSQMEAVWFLYSTTLWKLPFTGPIYICSPLTCIVGIFRLSQLLFNIWRLFWGVKSPFGVGTVKTAEDIYQRAKTADCWGGWLCAVASTLHHLYSKQSEHHNTQSTSTTSGGNKLFLF